VGALRPSDVDVRFIAATNRILFGEVKKGLFREDLYYRLQVVSINIPPLRDRGDDVMVLTDHFSRVFSARHGHMVKRMEPAVEEIFSTYSWPGNVRELSNLLERIYILEDDDVIRVAHIPARILREVQGEGAAPGVAPGAATGLVQEAELGFTAATNAFQRDLIREALESSGGNRMRAAQLLGLSRHALRHQMIKLGLAE